MTKEELKQEANKRNKKHRIRRRIIKTSIALFMTLLLVLSIIIPTIIIPKSKFTDIVAIAAGAYHTVGLKSDGTVVAAGYNNFGQCNVGGRK
jgi:alpha-tubulin suppressor-like RCC1 family protein